MFVDALKIMSEALRDAMPGEAVRGALSKIDFGEGKLIMVAAGKAGYEMG